MSTAGFGKVGSALVLAVVPIPMCGLQGSQCVSVYQ